MLQWMCSVLLTATAGIVMQTGGCASVISPGQDGEPTEPDAPAQPANTITVRFANESASALDVQFFASPNPPGDDIAMTFFDAANQIVTDIGFAGTGIIASEATDILTLNCSDAATIGTLGGEYLNADSGLVVGTGKQRVAQLGLQYDCGDRVTFIYLFNGDAFDTTLVID